MISFDYEADLPSPQRRAIEHHLRALLPRCDPDGRGRVAVRVTREGERVRVEVVCAAPFARAVVSDPDGAVAIREAFAQLAEAVGDPPHALGISSRRTA